MSTSPRRIPTDRPLLRLFSPPPTLNTTTTEGGEAQPYTLQTAHEQLRQPELAGRSQGYQQDCMRALAKWVEFEAVVNGLGQRIVYPLPISAITSSTLRAFQEFLRASTCLSPSSINRMVGEIKTTIALAGDEGIEIRPVRCKRIAEPTGSKIWIDELQIARLWSAAVEMDWPRPSVKPREGSTYSGTGLAPSTFWRAILVLLRSYGMRVQDLVAYDRNKSPITWADITFEARTPNPHGREEWPLGWLYYQSGKVGRKYYLPLTRHTRAAVDRLHAAAKRRAEAAGLDVIPSDWPILPCPFGGDLPLYWHKLCAAAQVTKPIKLLGVEAIGDKWLAKTNVAERQFTTQAAAEKWLAASAGYVLEDFRSTAATFYATIEKTLPNKVCGWADGEKKNVGRTNYINDEPFLLKYLPGSYQAGERFFLTEAEAIAWADGRKVDYWQAAPMPRCFDDWLQV